MLVGSFSIPEQVKKIFAYQEDEATAEVWFKLLEDDLLCQYILCPELKPKALTTGILALTQHQEVQAQIHNTAFAYLEYAQKKYSQIKELKNFYQMELNIFYGKNITKLSRQKIYARVVNWLERHLEHSIMIDYNAEISDLMKIIILSKSEIMFSESFQNLFDEKKLDLIALID